MPILCPPKNEAWKSLVDSLGDERHAYVAFFRNGDKLPDLATATKLLGPIPEKPSSSAIKDLDTGEVWSGEPTHGLLHDKIPNMNSRRLEAGFMTNRGNYWTQAQAESATGFSSGEELFVMSDKQRKAWRKTQAEVAAADQPQPVQPKLSKAQLKSCPPQIRFTSKPHAEPQPFVQRFLMAAQPLSICKATKASIKAAIRLNLKRARNGQKSKLER
jgi:hypothetical protein